VAVAQQSIGQMIADEARSAGDENLGQCNERRFGRYKDAGDEKRSTMLSVRCLSPNLLHLQHLLLKRLYL
jgi:hypothetical protein